MAKRTGWEATIKVFVPCDNTPDSAAVAGKAISSLTTIEGLREIAEEVEVSIVKAPTFVSRKAV